MASFHGRTQEGSTLFSLVLGTYYALVNILSVYPTVFIQKWPAILLTFTLFYAISAAKATSMARTVAITMANIRTSKTPQVRRVQKL